MDVIPPNIKVGFVWNACGFLNWSLLKRLNFDFLIDNIKYLLKKNPTNDNKNENIILFSSINTLSF